MRASVVLIVSGPPCSGKSTLVARLAARYSLVACEKDRVKEALFETLGTGDRAWSRRLSRASFEAIIALAGAAVAAGQSVILEGNFGAGQLAALEALRGRGARLVQILCGAPVEVLRERQERRARESTRHPGHLDALLAEELRADPRASFGEALAIESITLGFDSAGPPEAACAALFADLDVLVRGPGGPERS